MSAYMNGPSTSPQPPPQANGRRPIDKNTPVSLAILISVVFGAIYLTSWITKVDSRLERIEEDLNEATEDRWHRSEEIAIWHAYGALNPTAVIPPVLDGYKQ